MCVVVRSRTMAGTAGARASPNAALSCPCSLDAHAGVLVCVFAARREPKLGQDWHLRGRRPQRVLRRRRPRRARKGLRAAFERAAALPAAGEAAQPSRAVERAVEGGLALAPLRALKEVLDLRPAGALLGGGRQQREVRRAREHFRQRQRLERAGRRGILPPARRRGGAER
jgi:hypothetical protein